TDARGMDSGPDSPGHAIVAPRWSIGTRRADQQRSVQRRAGAGSRLLATRMVRVCSPRAPLGLRRVPRALICLGLAGAARLREQPQVFLRQVEQPLLDHA